MLGDIAREATAECMTRLPLQSRATVRLDGKPLEKNESPATNLVYKYTNGQYYIKYKPPITKSLQGKNFVIIADILSGGKIRVSDPVMFEYMKCGCPEIDWILKYTNYDRELFEIARTNIQLAVPFCIDMAKYSRMLKKQVEAETGVYPRYSMFRDVDVAKAEEARYYFWLDKNGVSKEEAGMAKYNRYRNKNKNNKPAAATAANKDDNKE